MAVMRTQAKRDVLFHLPYMLFATWPMPFAKDPLYKAAA